MPGGKGASHSPKHDPRRPFDTYILQARTLVGPFELVSYMPKFGMQAYFGPSFTHKTM